MIDTEVKGLQSLAIQDLTVELKDLKFLLDECRPWLLPGETPVDCIIRHRKEAEMLKKQHTVLLNHFTALKVDIKELLDRPARPR